MLDATNTVDTPVFSVPLSPSSSVNASTSLGKRRRGQQRQGPQRASKRIAAMRSPMTIPDFSPEEISTPVVDSTHTLISDTSLPSTRPKLTLKPTNNISTNNPESFTFPVSSFPEPVSPAATEIAFDISHVEPPPEDRIETLRAAGIKVRDFAYEPTPISMKAPEVFDPVPCLIAADWHMRNWKKKSRSAQSQGSLPSHQDGLAHLHTSQTLLQPLP